MGWGGWGFVFIGRAGTAKSNTVGLLAETWRRIVGGGVWGLATSQIAAMELADNGLDAMNTTRFLTTFTAHGPAGQRIGPGDLVVLDEVGMSSTAELARISRLVGAAGAKLLYTGDHEQLAAIGAGGMLALLVADNGCFELTEVHRFTHAWEQTASAGLRVGDTEALDVYERHGRLVGGSIEDLTDTVVRAYLADTIAGHESLLVAGSNSQAAELAGRIHDELVRLGRIDPQVLCTARDGNPVGVGDLIQARRNNTSIPVEGGGWVTNRVTYRVQGRNPVSGELRVSDPHDRAAWLPAGYVAEHVTLAYAATVYAAQGRTVDTCHALIEPGADRRSVYVSLTRGRASNTAYAVCERDPDGHLPERLTSTARAQLATAITRVDHDTSHTAEAARRAGLNEAASLAWIATQWDLVTTDLCAERCADALTRLLDSATGRAVLAEPGYPRLVRALRAAQLAGHDTDALLGEVVARRSLFGADSRSDVLRWRVGIATSSRRPEHDTAGGGWVAMTPNTGGPVGEYALALAQLAAHRQDILGQLAAIEPPDWAVHHLGPVPANHSDRAEWVRRAAVIAGYRNLADIDDQVISLGPAPSREQVLHRVLWQRAQAATGSPSDELDYTTATDTQLRQLRAAYQRALEWAPHWVHDELRDTRIAAARYHCDAQLWHTEAQLLPAGSPQRARADADVHAARHLAATYDTRAELLKAIDAARRQWHHTTQTARTRHDLAGRELVRRGLPRDPTPAPAEQLLLLDISPAGGSHPTSDERGQYPGPALAMRHPESRPLFDLAPRARDIASAQSLGESPDATDSATSTLGQAWQRVEILTDLHEQQHARWADTLAQITHQRTVHPGTGYPVSGYAGYLRRDTARDHTHNLDQDLDLDQGADY
jgi:hypothetical protein